MSWARFSNKSVRLRRPLGPSNQYSFSTAIHGMRRRSAASASRAWVSSFSLTRSFSRAAFHSCCDTIAGVFILCLLHDRAPERSIQKVSVRPNMGWLASPEDPRSHDCTRSTHGRRSQEPLEQEGRMSTNPHLATARALAEEI